MTDRPAEVFHPSVFIEEELTERGWSREFLALMSLVATINEQELNTRILEIEMYLEIGATRPEMYLGDTMAEYLGRAFGVDPQLFLNLETAWRQHQESSRLGGAVGVAHKVRLLR